MLSRTADHIYWLGRYVERAETLARALDVQHQLSLLPQRPDSIRGGWLDTLDELGLLPEYRARHGEVTVEAPPLFIAFADNTSLSIRGCLQAARENARAVRGGITSEMWETLNATWIELRDAGARDVSPAGLQHFIDWVKHRSQLLRGVWQGTMLRDEGFAFLRMRRKAKPSSRSIVPCHTPRSSCDRCFTQSMKCCSPAGETSRAPASRSSIQVAFSVSHISEVIPPRTARAFSRAACRQPRMLSDVLSAKAMKSGGASTVTSPCRARYSGRSPSSSRVSSQPPRMESGRCGRSESWCWTSRARASVSARST